MFRFFSLSAIAFALFFLACGPSDAPESSEGLAGLSSSPRLDPNQVPARLRHLVPLASQWGIGDDVERMEYIERSSPADRENLANSLAPYHAEITAWLDSFEPGAMSQEAAAFMYMQLVLEEVP
jgi:hypothetical protein